MCDSVRLLFFFVVFFQLHRHAARPSVTGNGIHRETRPTCYLRYKLLYTRPYNFALLKLGRTVSILLCCVVPASHLCLCDSRRKLH
jgi:hypothetical protein